MSDGSDNSREAMRQAAREAAARLQGEFSTKDNPLGWFDALYKNASGERGMVPWADAAPRERLRRWLADRPAGPGRVTAIDIGCGLGDNAVMLADAGYRVTAFDISDEAVAWARRTHPRADIEFLQSDLFHLPPQWRGRFDLVHETYNLQALPQTRVSEAIRNIASLAAPGGTVLVTCRARDAHERPEGPPWPLCREQLVPFEEFGLALVSCDEFHDDRDPPIRHFLIEYRREDG